MIGVRERGFYRLNGHPTRALVHNNISSSELWHKRLAHLHYKALPVSSKMVTFLPGMQIENDGVCKACALEKNARGSFPSSDDISEGILDIIQSYVCRQMTVPSLGKIFYFVTFIDDFSRMTWIYFLITKDEVFNKFHEFKALVDVEILLK